MAFMGRRYRKGGSGTKILGYWKNYDYLSNAEQADNDLANKIFKNEQKRLGM